MLYCPVNENKSSLRFATLTPTFFNSNTAGESSKFGFHGVLPSAGRREGERRGGGRKQKD